MQNGVGLDRCHENPSEDSEKVTSRALHYCLSQYDLAEISNTRISEFLYQSLDIDKVV